MTMLVNLAAAIRVWVVAAWDTVFQVPWGASATATGQRVLRRGVSCCRRRAERLSTCHVFSRRFWENALDRSSRSRSRRLTVAVHFASGEVAAEFEATWNWTVQEVKIQLCTLQPRAWQRWARLLHKSTEAKDDQRLWDLEREQPHVACLLTLQLLLVLEPADIFAEATDAYSGAVRALVSMGAEAAPYVFTALEKAANVHNQVAEPGQYSEMVRQRVALILAESQDIAGLGEAIAPLAVSGLCSSSASLRHLSSQTLYQVAAASGKAIVVGHAVHVLQCRESRARWFAIRILSDLGGLAAMSVAPLLEDEDEYVRLAAVEVLGNIGASAIGHAEAVAKRLQDTSLNVRLSASQALWNMGDSPSARSAARPGFASLLRERTARSNGDSRPGGRHSPTGLQGLMVSNGLPNRTKIFQRWDPAVRPHSQIC